MPENAPERVHDLLIVGAGPVGLALALALKDTGLDIVLADARTREAVTKDPRDLALAHGTRLTLQRLSVWDGLPSTAIEHIHISHQGGLGRTLIDAIEHDLPALGYVASAGALAAALRKAVDAAVRIVERRPRQVDAERLDAHVVDVVRLVEHDDRVFAHLATDLLGHFRIEQVVEAVDDDVGERHHPPHRKVRAYPLVAPVVLHLLERPHARRKEVAGLARAEFLL